MAELQQIVGQRGFEGDRLFVHPQPQALGFEAPRPVVADAADGSDRRNRFTRPSALGERELAPVLAGFELPAAAPLAV
jgi:hypothetical protein